MENGLKRIQGDTLSLLLTDQRGNPQPSVAGAILYMMNCEMLDIFFILHISGSGGAGAQKAFIC